MLRLLTNPLYLGKVEHSGALYAGEQAALVEPSVCEPIQEELRTRVRHALLAEHSKIEEGLPDRCSFISRAFVPGWTAFRLDRRAKVKLAAMRYPKGMWHETVTLKNPLLDVEIADGLCVSGGVPRTHKRLS